MTNPNRHQNAEQSIRHIEAAYIARLVTLKTLSMKTDWRDEWVKVLLKHADLIQARLNVFVGAMAEIKATNDGGSDQPISDIVEGCLKELDALKSKQEKVA